MSTHCVCTLLWHMKPSADGELLVGGVARLGAPTNGRPPGPPIHCQDARAKASTPRPKGMLILDSTHFVLC